MDLRYDESGYYYSQGDRTYVEPSHYNDGVDTGISDEEKAQNKKDEASIRDMWDEFGTDFEEVLEKYIYKIQEIASDMEFNVPSSKSTWYIDDVTVEHSIYEELHLGYLFTLKPISSRKTSRVEHVFLQFLIYPDGTCEYEDKVPAAFTFNERLGNHESCDEIVKLFKRAMKGVQKIIDG